MFAGKSTELIRRMERAAIAKHTCFIFKPKMDNRYSKDHVVSHNGIKIPCEAIPSDNDRGSLRGHVMGMISEINGPTAVGFDEAQFFDADMLVNLCEHLASQGARVIVAGLDQDVHGKPFGAMPYLLARADKVTKLSAICTVCGEEATKSRYTLESPPGEGGVIIGGTESYEARCRAHWKLVS